MTAPTDVWLNPASGTAGISFLGYDPSIEEFPHDLYSFYLSSFRDEDRRQKSMLLWRWLTGPQLYWESIYGKIVNLPLLYSPMDCSAEILEYLRYNVCIHGGLDYLWGVLSENEKRRLVRYFIRFLLLRSTYAGYLETLQAMTGLEFHFRGYFDYRWLLSGEEDGREVELGTFLGRDEEGYDPWLIDEDDVPSLRPDSIQFTTVGASSQYIFTVNTLIDAVDDVDGLPTEHFVKVTAFKTQSFAWCHLYKDGDDWKVRPPVGFFFDQIGEPLSVDVNDFRVGFEPGPYVFDVIVVDDGTANKDMILAICKFFRPMSERTYIRYFSMFEEFEDMDDWEETSGTVTFDEDEDTVELADVATNSAIKIVKSGSDTWEDYEVGVKAKLGVVSRYFDIRFMWQDDDNYLFLRVEPNPPPTIPTGTWSLYSRVGGVEVLLTSGTTDQFDVDVYYYWRIVAFVSGTNVQFHIFQDENELYSGSCAKPWTDVYGTVELSSEANGEVIVDYVAVHPYPMDNDYVGP